MACISCFSEKIHGVLPSLWNVSDLHVLLEGISESIDVFTESLTLWGMLEGFESSSGRLGFLVVESSTIGLLELWLPCRLIKSLILVLDILQLILDGLEMVVVDVDMVLALVDGIIESCEDIIPLCHESLAIRRL